MCEKQIKRILHLADKFCETESVQNQKIINQLSFSDGSMHTHSLRKSLRKIGLSITTVFRATNKFLKKHLPPHWLFTCAKRFQDLAEKLFANIVQFLAAVQERNCLKTKLKSAIS